MDLDDNRAGLKHGGHDSSVWVNPVRNSSGALNPAGIILKCNPAAAAGPGSAQEGLLPRREGLWPGGAAGHYF